MRGTEYDTVAHLSIRLECERHNRAWQRYLEMISG